MENVDFKHEAEWTIKEQKNKISSMRKENKELHKHKHDRLMVCNSSFIKFKSMMACQVLRSIKTSRIHIAS